MDRKLYEASIQGNVTSLINLLRQDPLIIHKYIVNPDHTDTPLHTAALLGHVDFVNEILQRKPDLARELNSQRSTALHLASATGHIEIVRSLLNADSETCTALDRYGMNPAHVAAIKGRVDVLREIVEVRPDAARMFTGHKLTILHLCVKYNQLEAMELLIDGRIVDDESVNFKDEDGNTILHLAVLDKQDQTVNFLLTNTSINTESKNAYGLTASDISKIYNSGRENVTESPSNQNYTLPPLEMLLNRLVTEQEERLRHSINKQKEQQNENRRNAIIIAATVIASMSFQVAANPPGGVWQDTSDSHVAGQAIMASVSPVSYKLFIVLNTVAFCGSAFVFLLMLSRLPFLVNNKYVIGVLNVALWIAILSSAICFTCSVIVTTPIIKMSVAFRAANVVMYLAFAMWGILFIGHVGCFVWKKVQRWNTKAHNTTQLPNSKNIKDDSRDAEDESGRT
ncbi:hypothetical protein V2J09_019202 [Rumex salicifolius]